MKNNPNKNSFSDQDQHHPPPSSHNSHRLTTPIVSQLVSQLLIMGACISKKEIYTIPKTGDEDYIKFQRRIRQNNGRILGGYGGGDFGGGDFGGGGGDCGGGGGGDCGGC